MIKITEPVICASRGRNPDNPGDRTTGAPNEQRLEVNSKGISNTLTTVQKDNLIIEPKIKNIGSINGHQSGNVLHQDSDLSPCLLVAGHVEPLKIMQVGNIVDTGNFDNPQRGRIYDPDGLAPALNTMQGGGLEPKFIEPQILKYERTEYGKQIRNQYEKGEINERRSNMREFTTRMDGVSNTLTTVQKDNYLFDSYRIRKLTPLECFRLMGFSDEEFYRIKGVSNTQLYKMAGNSIVVDVVEGIFNNLLRC